MGSCWCLVEGASLSVSDKWAMRVFWVSALWRPNIALRRHLVVFCLLLAARGADADPLPEPVRRYEPRKMQHPMLLHDRHHSGVSRWPAPMAGRVLWRTAFPGGVLASPAVDDLGRSYWATQSGQVIRLGSDGSAEVLLDFDTRSNTSPALDSDGNLYAASYNGRVVSLDPEGQRRWSVNVGEDLYSSPVVDEHGRRVIISARDKTLGFSLDTGDRVFTFSAGNSQNNSSPVLGPDGLVRLVNWEGVAMALDAHGGVQWRVDLGASGFWSSPSLGSFGTLYTAGESRRLLAISPAGRVLWFHQLRGVVRNGFIALSPGGQVLVPTVRGVEAVNPDGTLAWLHRLPPNDQLQASLAVSREGDVLFGTVAGNIVALDAQGQERWRVAPRGADRVKGGGAVFHSAVVIAAPVRGRPRAYLGSMYGDVYCLE